MIELAILAVIAVLVLYRLYVVLGRHGGEPSSAAERAAPLREARLRDVSGNPKEDPNEPPRVRLEDIAGPERAIAERDPNFDPAQFIRGARSAYKMIVEAFGAGDLAGVRDFIAPDVVKAFESALKDRKTKGHQVELEVERLEGAVIEDAKIRGDRARIRVSFDALVYEVVKDKDGRVVAGDPTEAQRRHEAWSFERDLGSEDPNWILAATGR